MNICVASFIVLPISGQNLVRNSFSAPSGPGVFPAFELSRKRNLTMEGRKQKVDAPSEYYVCKNGNKTWDECLKQIEQKAPFASGVTLSIEQAHIIKMELEDTGIIGIDNLLQAVNGCQHQAESLRKIVLENLPIVALKKKNWEEKFLDSRSFLAQPNLIVELWERQNQFQVIIIIFILLLR